jgi:hypothetical protein
MKYEETAENCILRNFTICTPSNIIRVINPRGMRWAAHVVQMRNKINAY